MSKEMKVKRSHMQAIITPQLMYESLRKTVGLKERFLLCLCWFAGWWMCKVNDKVGWAPPSYLKKVDRRECGESDSDDDYLGLLGCESLEPLEKCNSMDSVRYSCMDIILVGYCPWLFLYCCISMCAFRFRRRSSTAGNFT